MINNKISISLFFFGLTNILHASNLINVYINPLSNNILEINLQFDGLINQPSGYKIDNPARIALDFVNVHNMTGNKFYSINQGNVQNISFIETNNKMRAVLQLSKMVDYDVKAHDNFVKIKFNNSSISFNQKLNNNINDVFLQNSSNPPKNMIFNIDFQRDSDGSGNVIVELSDSNFNPNISYVGGNMSISFPNTFTPEELRLSLNVIDFATPVQKIKTTVSGENSIITIEPKGLYEHLSYQNGNRLIIGFKEIGKDKSDSDFSGKKKYTGERISYNLSGVPLKDAVGVLVEMQNKQVIYTGSIPQDSLVNISVKDTQSDQILDLILDNLGFISRDDNGIIYIGTKQDFLNKDKEKRELLASARQNEIPITETIQLSYARASEIIPFLQQVCSSNKSNLKYDDKGDIPDNNGCVFGSEDRNNILSITAIKTDLERLRREINKIDVPTQQVMIEARIIESNVSYTKNLGVSWTGGVENLKGGRGNWISGGTGMSSNFSNLDSSLVSDRILKGSSDKGINFGFIKNGSYLLDLQISAMENTGNGKIISRPKVIASNSKTATISKGTKIPFVSVKDGTASTEFLDAKLSLDVTPTVTPDGKIILKVTVDKDSPIASGSVATQNVNSEIIINDGETIVLGGIYTDSQLETIEKFPVLGDLPIIGDLFRKTKTQNDKTELLIFLTPKILHSESVSLN